MYCAVLYQTRIVGLRRTKASTVKAVIPLANIGHGWSRTATDARKGMNPTDVLTRAKGILKKNESLIMLKRVKAANAFQKREGNGPGSCQVTDNKTAADAAVTAPTST